jgi:hypothetical protein
VLDAGLGFAGQFWQEKFTVQYAIRRKSSANLLYQQFSTDLTAHPSSCSFMSAPSAMSECSTLLGYCTVKTVVPFTPFRLALMVVVPLEALLASPFDLMVATVTSDEVHVT